CSNPGARDSRGARPGWRLSERRLRREDHLLHVHVRPTRKTCVIPPARRTIGSALRLDDSASEACLGIFERYLSVWVAMAIAVGVALGLVIPGVFEVVSRLEWANVNLVVAVLIWVMIYPMMLKVEPSCLADVGRKPKGLALTLVVNWLIKPFTMAALGVLFFKHIFAGMLPAEDAQQYIAGMILL